MMTTFEKQPLLKDRKAKQSLSITQFDYDKLVAGHFDKIQDLSGDTGIPSTKPDTLEDVYMTSYLLRKMPL